MIEFSDETHVLDHFGKPRDFASWKRLVGKLAQRGNVYCKLPGLVTEVGKDVVGAYQTLFRLKDDQEGVKAVGIGAKDWRVIKELWNRGIRFDWVMFACAPTLLEHPPELLAFVETLKKAGVPLIDSAVFNEGLNPARVVQNGRYADHRSPEGFWSALEL